MLALVSLYLSFSTHFERLSHLQANHEEERSQYRLQDHHSDQHLGRRPMVFLHEVVMKWTSDFDQTQLEESKKNQLSETRTTIGNDQERHKNKERRVSCLQ